ncbi:DUF5675 family protein [Flavihumibacter sp. ZG627]|uniref:DUF5675 family protein n=1 Tax=Flavihumibacter sp. ZG627 TaxID=1463156 RepID=UPI00057E77A2|nr:DUF5675 family protein [Flavihumibacter sp. ZG627]KIC92286.1 hypothetical protein HY58_01700 [Flavihumibacter sp. ZG627]
MELHLQRRYYESGTNGILSHNGKALCYTIELPWRNNIRMESCIPEGKFKLVFRYSKRHKLHLMLQSVPGRTLILIHKANDAAKELKGCIAPVSTLEAPGKGTASAKAFKKLMGLVFKLSTLEKPIWLLVDKLPDYYSL